MTTSTSTTSQFFAPLSALGVPGYAIGALDTGLRGVDADTFDLEASGVQVARITAPAGANPRFRVIGGTAPLPGLSPLNDITSGLFWPGDNTTRISFGATEVFAFNADINVQLANHGIVAGAAGYTLVAGFVAATATEAVRLTNANTFTGGAGIAQKGTAVRNTINQTSTAEFVDFFIDRTQTAAGSGKQRLIVASVDGIANTKFDVDNLGGVGSAQWIEKEVDEPIINSTVLQDDDELTTTVIAGARYAFKFCVFVSVESAAPGIKIGVGGTATATSFKGETLAFTAAALAAADRTPALGSGTTIALAIGLAYITIEGSIEVDAGGTFLLSWAQGVSSADDTIVQRNSTLEVRRCLG